MSFLFMPFTLLLREDLCPCTASALRRIVRREGARARDSM
jgi:hypothetical protein